MDSKRWQPPPLDEESSSITGEINVDQQLMQKLLFVNPALVESRAFEQIMTTGQNPASPKLSGLEEKCMQATHERLERFFREQAGSLEQRLRVLDIRRRNLDEEENRVLAASRNQVLLFLGLLDCRGLSDESEILFAKYERFLEEIGLSSELLLETPQH